MNRDAELNRIGLEQAGRTGELLREANVFGMPLLVVISPMRRTLQTTIGVFGADAWDAPTLVHPLAAETNVASRFKAPGVVKKLVATVQQGDHGSTPAALREMFPPERHPQLDFSAVERYCVESARPSSRSALAAETARASHPAAHTASDPGEQP